MFHSEGSEALKESTQFEMKNTSSRRNEAFERLTFSLPFCQTSISSTQKGMLRRAYCLLGERIWPPLTQTSDTPQAFAQRQGSAPRIPPLRTGHRQPFAFGRPPALPALSLREVQGDLPALPLSAGLAGCLPKVRRRERQRCLLSVTGGPVAADAPKLPHRYWAKASPHLHPHPLEPAAMEAGIWFWEKTVLTSGKSVKRLKS